jgi:hypothetical protein
MSKRKSNDDKEKKNERPLFSTKKASAYEFVEVLPGQNRALSKTSFERINQSREKEIYKLHFVNVPKEQKASKIVASTEDETDESNRKPAVTSKEPMTSRPKVKGDSLPGIA